MTKEYENSDSMQLVPSHAMLTRCQISGYFGKRGWMAENL